MKIKKKLTFGVGLLFLLILLLAGVSGWYINQMKTDTNNILSENYYTLQYSRNMLLALENISDDTDAITEFQENLNKQKENVTEIGEQEITDLLVKHFNTLKKDFNDSITVSLIREDIAQMMHLNMESIERKSNTANDTAQHAILVISVTAVLCFIIAFILLVNLPANIANPITELTKSIKEIANQNYKKRVHFKKNDEFGELATSFNIMAEKLEEYSESRLGKIMEGKKRIDTLIDTMHDPVIGIDENQKVLFINEEALKITGLKRKEIVAQQIQNVAVSNDLIRDIIKDIINPSEKSATSQPLKIYANNKESYFEKEVIDINILPTGETKKRFAGQVIILKNITPFKELDLAKNSFMGTISHEFKTPIASIQMGLQLLKNQSVGNLNEEQDNLVIGIQEDADRLLKITRELLNITQVESGSMQLNVLSSEVEPIIDYAIKANKVSAEQKNITLNIEKEDEVHNILADSEKTAWVLTNLLSNAIRYSHENSSILIKIQQKGKRVYFSVTDTGQGIDPQYLDKIFERYFRIPGSKKEGTGLGLSISKDFIEAQGGEISVESEFGVGSTFTFWLKGE